MKKLVLMLSATALLAMSQLANAQEQGQEAAEGSQQSAVETVATDPADAPAAEAPALSQAVRDAIGAPSEGKALVVFFRPSKFTGAAISFKVRENDVELGQLKNGNYFAQEVEPGAHAYVVHSEAKDITNVEVEAGDIQFLAASISMGFMAGRPNLAPSDAAAFEAALPKLKKSKPID